MSMTPPPDELRVWAKLGSFNLWMNEFSCSRQLDDDSREFFVCFQDGIPQSAIELAFKFGFGSALWLMIKGCWWNDHTCYDWLIDDHGIMFHWSNLLRLTGWWSRESRLTEHISHRFGTGLWWIDLWSQNHDQRIRPTLIDWLMTIR